MATFPTPTEKYDHQDHIDATCTSKVTVKVTDSASTLDLHSHESKPTVNASRKMRRAQKRAFEKFYRRSR